jgi:hypothetical protein
VAFVFCRGRTQVSLRATLVTIAAPAMDHRRRAPPSLLSRLIGHSHGNINPSPFLVASHTTITLVPNLKLKGYCHQDPRSNTLHTRPRTSFSGHRSPPYPSQTGRLQTHTSLHFPQRTVRRVRRNTFLSRCRPPWPPPPCLNHTPRSPSFRPSAGRPVHPDSQSPLTADRPLGSSQRTFRLLQQKLHPYITPPLLARCPERHFRGNQLPDCSIGLSPLHPSLASSCTSERATASRGRSASFAADRHSSQSFGSHRTHAAPWSPWSVFQDGSDPRPTHTFILHTFQPSFTVLLLYQSHSYLASGA